MVSGAVVWGDRDDLDEVGCRDGLRWAMGVALSVPTTGVCDSWCEAEIGCKLSGRGRVLPRPGRPNHQWDGEGSISLNFQVLVGARVVGHGSGRSPGP